MIGAQPARQTTPQASGEKARIPFWRRITALFSLSFMVIIGGLALAGLIGLTALMMLFLLERAIAT